MARNPIQLSLEISAPRHASTATNEEAIAELARILSHFAGKLRADALRLERNEETGEVTGSGKLLEGNGNKVGEWGLYLAPVTED